jgi:hypothetical protein
MYSTIYKKTVKRRKTGITETDWRIYETKSLSPMHRSIRFNYPEAITVKDAKRIITHFCIGIPLDEPMISGGERV